MAYQGGVWEGTCSFCSSQVRVLVAAAAASSTQGPQRPLTRSDGTLRIRSSQRDTWFSIAASARCAGKGEGCLVGCITQICSSSLAFADEGDNPDRESRQRGNSFFA